MEIDNLKMKKELFTSLNERQRRQFLGVEAEGLGYGGISAVSKAFGVARCTVSRGLNEVKSGERLAKGRVRKEGGGRKKNGNRT